MSNRWMAVLAAVGALVGTCVAVLPAATAQPGASTAAPVAGPVPGTFRSLVPTRLLDTRSAFGGTAPGAHGVVQLQVAGRGGVPSTGVAAVALNVTVTAPATPGYVTVYPDGIARPNASNLNFVAHQTVANVVIAKLGTGGVVDVANGSVGTVQLIADVSGYYTDGTAGSPGTLTPLPPARVLDTRSSQGGSRLAAHGVDAVAVTGLDGVPAGGVSAVVLNVTATGSTAPGYLTVYADGAGRPNASNLNFGAGATVPNLVFASVGADGKVDVFNGAAGTVNVVADVMGYVSGGTVTDPGGYVVRPPTRVLDTRSDLGAAAPAAGGTVRLSVAGHAGVPASSLRAVVLNVTVTGSTRNGFVTAYPDGQSRPGTSNVNFLAGATLANLVVVPVGSDGKVDLYNGSIGTTQLIADVEGYYVGTYGEPAGSCAGFTNSTGVTDSTITLANASDVSGPVPNLYAAAQQGVEAYAAYFNSVSDICGRSLSVESLDTQTSSAGDLAAATTACTDAFALVGSMASFDDGGAATANSCGIPDLRARPTSVTRRDEADSFAVSYPDLGHVPAVVPNYFVQHDATAVQHAAMIWLAGGPYPLEAASEMQGWTLDGFTFKYHAGIDVTAFNYTTYVSAMISAGIQYVQFDGPPQYAVRLLQAMQAQNFTPVFVVDPAGADASYAAAGGSAANGTYSFTDAALMGDTGNPELARYENWLQVVAPGAVPSTIGLYAWSAALLFTARAQALGGTLTRASLISALSHVSGWTGNGLQTPEAVGAKTPASCAAITTLDGGVWQRASAGQYLCGTLTATPSG